jgi:hypothetical protein
MMNFNTSEVWGQLEETGKGICYEAWPVEVRAQLLRESKEFGVRLNITTIFPKNKLPRLYVYLLKNS